MFVLHFTPRAFQIVEHAVRVGKLIGIDRKRLVVMLYVDIDVQAVERNLVFAIFIDRPLQNVPTFITITSLMVAQDVARL